MKRPVIGRWQAVVGDAPALCYEGERAYFPHVIVDPDRKTMAPFLGTLVINEGPIGPSNALPDFDEVAKLVAAAPRMLALLRLWVKADESCDFEAQAAVTEQRAELIEELKGVRLADDL